MHRLALENGGGQSGVRDEAALKSCIAQPSGSFAGRDLYEGTVAKVVQLGFLIIQNHPFFDGNKRTGHMALVTTLAANGWFLLATDDELHDEIIRVAEGRSTRDQFLERVRYWAQRRV